LDFYPERQLTYYVFMLLLEAAMIGVSFRSTYLSFIFSSKLRWSDVLPDWHLAAQRRVYAAVKFFIYTSVGSLLMLVGSSRSTSFSRGRPALYL